MASNPIPTGVPITVPKPKPPEPEERRKPIYFYGAHTDEELLGVKTGRFTSEKSPIEEVDKKSENNKLNP